MNLKPTTETLYGQSEFMRNSVGMEFKTAGITLDAAAFPAGEYVKAGTAVYQTANDLYAPVAAATLEADIAGGAAVLTSHDVKIVAGSNPIIGGLMAGHPDRDKCTGVTDAFVAATRNRLHFDL